MFIGRTQELKQLETVYRAKGHTAVVVYGRLGVGKTELARQFLQGKPVIFYAARELSEQEQEYLLSEEIVPSKKKAARPVKGQSESVEAESVPTFQESFHRAAEMLPEKSSKILVVLDEFHYMVKTGMEFLEAFVAMMNETEHTYMFLLLSSSVNWVENDMARDLSIGARYLSGILKLKEFTFVEMVNRFPNMPVEHTIYANAVLGGVPGYLEKWSERESVKNNIVRLMLSKNAPLLYEAEHFLKSELRELSAYNAILATLASGKYKLNDIYARTGFSRAKISVYIKNLIELDVVEKIFSYDAAEHANVQKGLYRIKDNYLCFWYRYVFPNLSAILRGEGEAVYMQKILPVFDGYMKESFGVVCGEYLKLLTGYERLRFPYTTWGTWYGKKGRIDIVAGDEAGNTLVGFCRFDGHLIGRTDYEEYVNLLSSATLAPKEFYLFSKAGFTDELRKMAQEQGIVLVGLEDL